MGECTPSWYPVTTERPLHVMMQLIKQIPIPTAGVALGLAALGNLLQPYSELAHLLCGIGAAALMLMLLVKIVRFAGVVREDFRNPIFASVSGTFFMTLMQLATYLEPFSHGPAFVLWSAAVLGHAVLIVWFTAIFIAGFKLSDVYPTYFICYVGIGVGAATSPSFGMEALGRVLFYVGFACYLVLLVIVSLRYIKLGVPEGARPLFCIYSAPMSLSLVGYLTATPEPNLAFALVLGVLAQAFFAMVLLRLPSLLRLPFYPSFAAMTFPFVITATGLGKVLALAAANGLAVPTALNVLLGIETVFATVMVLYVVARYLQYFYKLWTAGRVAPAPETHPLPGTAELEG